MDIFFPEDEPTFSASPPEIRFTVLVDDEPVVCAISAEALSEHFDADGPFEEAMLAAFHTGRHRIFAVCRATLERNAGHPVILRSGIFRFASASGQA